MVATWWGGQQGDVVVMVINFEEEQGDSSDGSDLVGWTTGRCGGDGH